MPERIRSIEVILREADLVDWLCGEVDRTDDELEEAIASYCERYAQLIEDAYPEAEVVIVDAGHTSGNTVIVVNGESFGHVMGFGYDDHGVFGGAPEHIHRLEERMVDEWQDPKEA